MNFSERGCLNKLNRTASYRRFELVFAHITGFCRTSASAFLSSYCPCFLLEEDLTKVESLKILVFARDVSKYQRLGSLRQK